MEGEFKKHEEIIVSFTTWKKRIHLASNIIKIMLKQTIVPNKIVLVLSTDEFSGIEKELPLDLLSIISSNKDICEILWVKENTKVWKKFMPTMDKYPNSVIIPVDDDIDYPLNYIESLYREYEKWNSECPIVCCKNIRKYNVYSHSGPFSLVKKDFFGKYLDELYNELVLKHPEIHWQSDEVYTYAMWLNGKRYKYTNAIDGNWLYKSSQENKINAYSNYKEGWGILMANMHKLLDDFIVKKYKKNERTILASDIIVNFTTWSKRDWAVPIMLKHFKKQTLKPKKIICWLSKEEYNFKIPDSIKQSLADNLLDEVKWVEGNTYAHKRWETFKENSNCYNIMIDDDILYDEHFVGELYNTSLSNQNCAIMWTSRYNDFIGIKRHNSDCELMKPSIKTQTLSGMSCYPPFTFPVESFKLSELRDKYCTKCDDSWVRAWLIKNDIKIVPIHSMKKTLWKTIDGTINTAVWNENKSVNNGIMKIVNNFANAIQISGSINEVLSIWPKFDVISCCDSELISILNKTNCEKTNNNEKNKFKITYKKTYKKTAGNKPSRNTPYTEHRKLMRLLYS